MTTRDNSETVKAFLATQYAGDLDKALGEFASPGFSWVVGSVDNAELRGAIPGPATDWKASTGTSIW